MRMEIMVITARGAHRVRVFALKHTPYNLMSAYTQIYTYVVNLLEFRFKKFSFTLCSITLRTQTLCTYSYDVVFVYYYVQLF